MGQSVKGEDGVAAGAEGVLHGIGDDFRSKDLSGEDRESAGRSSTNTCRGVYLYIPADKRKIKTPFRDREQGEPTGASTQQERGKEKVAFEKQMENLIFLRYGARGGRGAWERTEGKQGDLIRGSHTYNRESGEKATGKF